MAGSASQEEIEVRVLFFGATAAVTAKQRLDMSVAAGVTAMQLRDRILGQYPELSRFKLHLSLNREYVTSDHALSPGDELALFTAVSGG